LHADAPDFFHGLTGRAAPLIALSAVAGMATLVLVWRREFELARYAGALAVVAVLWGWAAAQYPWLLIDHLHIDEGAGARTTLVALLATLSVGVVLLLPPLIWLLTLTHRGALAAEPDEEHEEHV